MFKKKTIKDVPLDGQTVLIRADFNVPLKDGQIVNDYRIQQTLPTLRHLIDRGCSIIICAHLGRPKGQFDLKFSLEPVALHLGQLLGQPVRFVGDCIGDNVRQAAKQLPSGQILLLENLRFYPQEEANDQAFASQLARDTTASYFIQDGFGVVHRAHASTAAITAFLPSIAGLLLEKEVSTITEAMSVPQHPFVSVLGGAKISDKIKVIKKLIPISDTLIIGGAMANTFLKYRGLPIGKSIHEDGMETEIAEIYRLLLEKSSNGSSVNETMVLPTEVIVAKSLDEGSPNRLVDVRAVEPDDYILDIAGNTLLPIEKHLALAKMVIWNGTMGMAEQPAYAAASQKVAEILAAQSGQTFSIIGGGDTVEFVLNWDCAQAKKIGIVSTGGGASLDLIGGDKLPGVEVLLDK